MCSYKNHITLYNVHNVHDVHSSGLGYCFVEPGCEGVSGIKKDFKFNINKFLYLNLKELIIPHTLSVLVELFISSIKTYLLSLEDTIK